MPTHIANNTPGEAAEISIPNNGFFPDLSLTDFKTQYRVDNPVSDEAARMAVQMAMITTNGVLATWHAEQIASGYLNLEVVPAPTYEDISEKVLQYQTAVYYRAKADIVDQYRDYDTTKSGHDRADEMESKTDDYIAKAHNAVSDLLGKSRSVVELI
ncbi:head completion/stabilization protein [Maricurvus nonylphenolicus]|uniref:head completion/stabilization protein n=1 Tax=Maricurvus nonylphenolicus TaxID=1008307 RepID=UPI0036F30C31